MVLETIKDINICVINADDFLKDSRDPDGRTIHLLFIPKQLKDGWRDTFLGKILKCCIVRNSEHIGKVKYY